MKMISVKNVAAAFCVMANASGAMADDCKFEYRFEMNDNEVQTTTKFSDDSNNMSAYRNEDALKGVYVAGRSFEQVARELKGHLLFMNLEYGLNMIVEGGNGNEGVFLSDSIAFEQLPSELANEYADLAVKDIQNFDPEKDEYDSKSKILRKYHSIIEDIEKLGALAQSLNVSLDRGVRVEANATMAYGVQTPQCN